MHTHHTNTETARTSERSSTLIHANITDSAIRGLISDWELMCRRGSILRQVNAWGLPGEPVDHLDDIVRRAGFGKAVDDNEADHYLWQLTCIAVTNEVASRIVLQRLLPPMIAIAKRRGQIMHGGFSAAFDEVLPTTWEVIRTFPIDRRKHKIAANMSRDIEYYAFVRNQRLRRVVEIPVEHDITFHQQPTAPNIDAADELQELINNAHDNGLSDAHTNLLRRLAQGGTTDDVGEEQGVSGRTIRVRRLKALQALRDISATLA